MDEIVYLDNAATTPISSEVLDAMMPYLKDNFGNAGTMYSLGRQAANAITKARRQVADLIGCDPRQVIFTSGGSEANSLVFEGLKPYLLAINKTHIITSKTEHDSVLKSVRSLCNSLSHNDKNNIKSDFGATFLAVDSNGVINTKDLENAITDHTGLVSVMYVNNETGAENPIKCIGEICKDRNILFHTDCVQAVGFQDINTKDIGCDFLSISAHKIGAPKGMGALYAKDPSKLLPIIHGGAAQEFGYRGGTENVAGIVGFGTACEILIRNYKADRHKIIELKTIFMDELKKQLANLKHILHINSAYDQSKILNIRFDNVDGQTLLLMLDSKEIYVSAGSACRSHESEPSHVLLAMGLSEDEARSSIRISFSHMLSKRDILTAAETMAQCVTTLIKSGCCPL